MQINDIIINYKEFVFDINYSIRRGSDVCILFLHGLGDSKSEFEKAFQIKELEEYTMVSFDQPGHGKSPYVSDFQIDDLVEITDQFIKSLRLKNVVLVGHSMGGLIGTLLLHNYQNSIIGFINVEGNLTKDDCGFTNFISNYDYEKFLVDFKGSEAMYDLAPSMVKYSKGGDLFNIFINLQVKKIFVYGEKSDIPVVEQMKNTNLSIYEIPESGHHSYKENPDVFYKVVSDFLELL